MSNVVPLYRALSKLGYTSRTQALALIAAGEISVDGRFCLDPEYKVNLGKSRIYHQGSLVKPDKLRMIMLYKPKGIITSRKDEKSRPTVYSLLPHEYSNLHCVGRLDWATSGLLLLTNSTLLSSWLTDPVNNIPRVYVVTVRGLMTEQDAEQMITGIIDNNQELQSDNVIVRKASHRESHLVITLSEGKNREVRRLCGSVGHEVTKLKRVAYGGLILDNMSPGEYRELSWSEINAAFSGVSHIKALLVNAL